MATDPVPWAINGSQLDTYVMRQFASFATQDSEGIQLPGHMKVQQTSTASQSVRVAIGGCCARNHAAAGQSYIGRNASETVIPMAVSGTARTDLIIATFRDDAYSPWSSNPYTGAAILTGPYFYIERIASVSPTTTKASQVVSYSALALARIAVPASGNITDAMITDLRKLALPRTAFAATTLAGPATADILLLTETSNVVWPATTTTAVVPDWATHCVFEASLNTVRVTGAANAYLSGQLVGTSTISGTDNLFDYNDNASPTNAEGVPFTVFADLNVQALQGQTVTARVQGRRFNTGAAAGEMSMSSRNQVIYNLRFVERTV